MIEKEKVTGSACLNYINKAIGLVQKPYQPFSISNYYQFGYLNFHVKGLADRLLCGQVPSPIYIGSTAYIWSHDESIRKVGLILDETEDNGLHIALLSTDSINYRDVRMFSFGGDVAGLMEYEQQGITDIEYISKKDDFYANEMNNIRLYDYVRGKTVGDVNCTFDEMLDYSPYIESLKNIDGWSYKNMLQNGQYLNNPEYVRLTTDSNTTLHFGIPIDVSNFPDAYVKGDFVANPLYPSTGNLYMYLDSLYIQIGNACPDKFESYSEFAMYDVNGGEKVNNGNGVAIPYNLILTKNVQYAQNYLNNGVLPPDAFLYPMDWENLPSYNDDDDGEDGDDDNTPDDTTRDITPNLPVVPSFTPSMLSNNNYYWLTALELRNFINWYWNDVGEVSDIDDLLAKIEGLYNNLSQAIINIRFMPVEYKWICKLPEGETIPKGHIKIAQIEKDGNVDMISPNGKPMVRDIGHIHIPNKYNSFVDLAPYSQLSLYLPYHGFLDLDITFLSGHDLYVKAVYDHISGTIQYLIYYDNQFLINTIIAKMAMDIPISLQTKNDRDSSIFSNVSNAVSGLIGAGLTLGTGNPMGLVIGANAFNSGFHSAPLNVKGNVGEQGSFFAPPQCAIILRRPTISKPSQDIWKSRVGQMCGKSYTLNNLKGYTVVYNPQITFKGNYYDGDQIGDAGVYGWIKPLEEEIQEIYDWLEKGVII